MNKRCDLEANISKSSLSTFTMLLVASLALCVTSCAAQTSPGTPPDKSPAKSAETKPAAQPPAASAAPKGDEINLFDGKTLAGWREADFVGRGAVKVKDGRIILNSGYMTGICYTNALPQMNYEISLEAMRVDGSDFFCGLTFPVSTNSCSLVVGGWGGGLVGLSSLDGQDAANNETSTSMSFTNGAWYRINVRVLSNKIQAWINDEKVVDVATVERQIGIRMEMEPCVPFGVATWSTTGALRNIKIRKL